MNAIILSSLRAAALATTLFLLPAAGFASDPSANDRAQLLLATTGSIPVKAAGPYVEVGTFRIQVSAKLGQPSDRLGADTWLYRNFSTTGSGASGTLVVRFNQAGRVQELSLATPALVAALKASPRSDSARMLVASQGHR